MRSPVMATAPSSSMRRSASTVITQPWTSSRSVIGKNPSVVEKSEATRRGGQPFRAGGGDHRHVAGADMAELGQRIIGVDFEHHVLGKQWPLAVATAIAVRRQRRRVSRLGIVDPER